MGHPYFNPVSSVEYAISMGYSEVRKLSLNHLSDEAAVFVAETVYHIPGITWE